MVHLVVHQVVGQVVYQIGLQKFGWHEMFYLLVQWWFNFWSTWLTILWFARWSTRWSIGCYKFLISFLVFIAVMLKLSSWML